MKIGKINFGSLNVVTIEIKNAEFEKKIGFLERHKKSNFLIGRELEQ